LIQILQFTRLTFVICSQFVFSRSNMLLDVGNTAVRNHDITILNK